MDKSVRYEVNGDNGVLREALLQTWSSRCCWCRSPATFLETEIDHIVPRDLEGRELKDALRDLALPSDFDIHSPENLAPIHGYCNNEKRKSFFGEAPRFLSLLSLAKSRCSRVVAIVNSFHKSRNLERALVAVQAAGAADGHNRTAMLTLHESLARSLWPENYFREFEVDLGEDAPDTIWVNLDTSSSRRSIQLLDQIGQPEDLAESVSWAVEEAWRRAYERVRDHFQGFEVGNRPVTCSDVFSVNKSISIDSIDSERDDEYFVFEFRGSIEAHFSTGLAVASEDGSELCDSEQGEAFVSCTFGFATSSDVGVLRPVDDVEVEGLDDVEFVTTLDGQQREWDEAHYSRFVERFLEPDQDVAEDGASAPPAGSAPAQPAP